jgi:uncharacterized iron-regulated membrane protein
MSWQQWLHHPEKSTVRQIVFQVHFWIGAMAAAYVFVMSITGSLLVFRGELFEHTGISQRWVSNLHTDLLSGAGGRLVNGFGAIALTVLCLTGAVIWWPGIQHWRRSLTVEWRARFPRVTWDLHSALGFWGFAFVCLWGLSGSYLVFPDEFSAVFFVDPVGKATLWLSLAHFGRFGWFAQAIWTIAGLIPAVLAFTGMFICCRRVIFKKPSNPKHFVS